MESERATGAVAAGGHAFALPTLRGGVLRYGRFDPAASSGLPGRRRGDGVAVAKKLPYNCD
jgi:hypothetical protein